MRFAIYALRDALDGMQEMIGYVPIHLQETWQYRDYIDRAVGALAVLETEEMIA